MSQILVRRTIPLGIAIAAVILTNLEYFVVSKPISDSSIYIRNWATILAPFLLILGTLTLVRRHSRDVMRRARRWPLSMYMIALIVVTVVIGSVYGLSGATYVNFYNTLYLYPFATVATLHGFSTIVANFRMLRFRSIESALFILGNIFVILSWATFGAAIWADLPLIGTWINDVPTSAALRAATIGSGIAMISTAVKALAGIERGWMGRE